MVWAGANEQGAVLRMYCTHNNHIMQSVQAFRRYVGVDDWSKVAYGSHANAATEAMRLLSNCCCVDKLEQQTLHGLA